MLRLGRGSRLQQIILDNFPPRGTRPTPIWDLHQFEPDAARRNELQWLIARFGVSEADFLRWRNACVAPNIETAIGYLQDGSTNIPIWVTSHLLRRKVEYARQASLAAHLALISTTSSNSLTRGHEIPLMLALKYVTQYNDTHALPGLVSRVLALPDYHHAKLFAHLSRPTLAPSPLIAAALERVANSARISRIILPPKLWLQVWERWGVTEALGEGFSAWLKKIINEQGVILPYARSPSSEKTHTAGAMYPQSRSQLEIDPRLASITAAAQSSTVSANLLLGMAHTLVEGFFPDAPNSGKPPDAAFLTALIQGLVQRRAYGRALAVWEDTVRKIASSSTRSNGRSKTSHQANKHKRSPPSSASPPPVPLTLTSALLEIGLSTYAKSGNPLRALQILDKYSRLPLPYQLRHPRFRSSRVPVASSTLNDIIEQIPPRAQLLLFTHSAWRWGIQPDSTSFEIVMRDVARLVRHGPPNGAIKDPKGDLDGETSFGAHVREFRDGLRRLFGGTGSHKIQARESKGNPKGYESQLNAALGMKLANTPHEIALIRQDAIELFRTVVLGNWPFIAGTEEGYRLTQNSDRGPDFLTPKATAMFVPIPLREPKLSDVHSTSVVDEDHPPLSHPTTTFTPTPLHPSPNPRFRHAHPTPRTWTAYIALLTPDDIPEAFQWMRAADEFLRPPSDDTQRSNQRAEGEFDGLAIFRPERAALVDALVRWEGAILAQETPVGRAWSERSRKMRREDEVRLAVPDKGGRIGGFGRAEGSELNDGVGREGELRAWLVDWLGPEGVPSRDEVAHARIAVGRN